MKKVLSFMLAILLLMSMLPTGALSVCAETTAAKTVGDLDQDGEITDWDGVLLARHLAGWSITVVDEKILDIDGDGEITDWDGVMFDRHLAGWSVVTQVGKSLIYAITYANTMGAANANPTSYENNGAQIPLSAISTEHYIFDGWYIGNNKVTHIPTDSEGDLTITARWTPVEYAIAYTDTKGAANSNPVAYHIESDTIVLQNLVCDGYIFDGWYQGNRKVTEIPAGSTGNITLTAKWSACDYTITYENTKGATNNNPIGFSTDSGTITLTNLNKTGYTFDGWYQGSQKVTQIPTGTTGNITLTAQWTPITYTATFTADGSVVATRYFTVEDSAISSIPNVPSKAGYTGAWSNYNLDAANIVIPAVYTLNEYTITYTNTRGAENSNPNNYTVITSTFQLAELQREGYDFLGWYKGSTKVTSIEKGTVGNITLTAKWSAVDYVITYTETKGASNANPAEYNVETGTIYLTNLVAEHYTFNGWYWNGREVTSIPAGNIGDIELVARWTPVSYSLTYQDTKGVTNTNPATYTVEDMIVLQDIRADGYTFEGWYLGGEKVTTIPVGSSGTKTLTAKWTTIAYSITYNDEKNLTHSNPGTYTVESGKITLAPLSAVGYTFEGWYNGNTQVTSIPAGSVGDLVLTAKWSITNYAITYLGLKDFDNPNPSTYTINDTVVLESLLTGRYPEGKTGYDFLGWYMGDEQITEIPAGSTGNLTLTAKWAPHVYAINYRHYDTRAIMGNDPATYNPNASVTSLTIEDLANGPFFLQNPTRDGYTFIRWRIQSPSGTYLYYSDQYGITAGHLKDYAYDNYGLRLYAEWEPIEYKINYVSDIDVEITNPNPAVYTTADSITLADASSDHFTFKGWYADAEYKTPVTTIEKGKFGEITLYAKWEFNGTYIYSAEDFAQIAYNPDGAYRLMASISVNATICDSLNPFTGYFDGNNFTIRKSQPFDVISGTVTNVNTEKKLATTNSGIISYCIGGNGLVQTNSGTIKFSGSNGGYTYTSQYDSGFYSCIAGFVATNTETGKIIGCYSKTEIGKNTPVRAAQAGGLVGKNYGLIENCYFDGYLCIETAYPAAAGLVGSGTGTIRNCYTTGSVGIVATPTGTGPYGTSAFGLTAGLVADHGHTIENSFSHMRAKAGVSIGGACTTTNTYYASDMCSYAWAAHNYYEISASGTGGTTGTGTISSNFKSSAFVQNTLGWSAEYWVFKNGSLPKLKWEQ